MFTGIVQQLGEITHIATGEESLRLTIQSDFADLQLGESVAIDGICLTVTQAQAAGEFTCDVSPETWQVTAASQYQAGRKINLERALQLHDRLGGHFVLGHVDECATLIDRQSLTDYVVLTFEIADAHASEWLVAKGSVCINGVSLTINQVERVERTCFNVMIIPHTLANTNLALLSIGERVNIEYDYLAKIVRRQLTTILPNVLDKKA
jgi:riboflavin synthase